jgi:precorrin-4 C11-methyltransferase
MTTIITHSNQGEELAQVVSNRIKDSNYYRSPSPEQLARLFDESKSLIFIGALGICVRTIAPLLKSKKKDPAVINIDVHGRYVQPVISGHIGGANELARSIAAMLGATPVITTVSDTIETWSLDMLPAQFGWIMEENKNLTSITASFVNQEPTALLLEARDRGTATLEAELPPHVSLFFDAAEIDITQFSAILAVTPFIRNLGSRALFYRPRMVALGVGCQRDADSDTMHKEIISILTGNNISPLSVEAVGSCDLKKDEMAIIQLATALGVPFKTFDSSILDGYQVPNPSEKVSEVTNAPSVSEASAMHLSGNGLIIQKTKFMAGTKHATMAAAILSHMERKGMVEIVGAGPGDPQLVTVRGKQLLQSADLILYAGSLVPVELTHYAKPGCKIVSSADMDLQQQIDLMKSYYDRKLLIVRLHTGDPCIYGAIQEQMNLMDKLDMQYRITPGVSSFQAAAAALQSQFTIPEEVQTIILTRGEGRTPMPEREQLHKLAQSQSTMCIYLSATLASKVETELLMHYPKDTPVAICHKLTWKEEKIIRCTLGQLAATMEEAKLSMTTLIVVGKAIDNRQGESKLYHKEFKHAFRR